MTYNPDLKQFMVRLHHQIAHELRLREIDCEVEDWWPTLRIESPMGMSLEEHANCEVRWEEERKDSRGWPAEKDATSYIPWTRWWLDTATDGIDFPFDLKHELSLLVKTDSQPAIHAEAIEYLLAHYQKFDELEDSFHGHRQWKELKHGT